MVKLDFLREKLKAVFPSKKDDGAQGHTSRALAGEDALSGLWRFDEEGRRPGTWWWWFWIFFFENEENPLQKRQLMILWSTKDDSEIECNGKVLKLRDDRVRHEGDKVVLDGAVAAWYFDGKAMRENFVLEQGDIVVDALEKTLSCSNKANGVGTRFWEDKSSLHTLIEKGKGREKEVLEFDAKVLDDDFSAARLKVKSFFKGKFDYRILRVNRLSLKCNLSKKGGKKKALKGTAYFQKVMVNAPAVPWHWGIVHFDKGSTLSYFAPHVGLSMLESNLLKGVATQSVLSRANKALSKELLFYNEKTRELHAFRNIKVRSEKNAAGFPAWRVSAHNDAGEKLLVGLNSYSQATWRFRKNIANLPVKSTLYYNEYPVHVDKFEFVSKSGKKVTLKDLGEGFGNAEHSWGFLI